MITAFQKGEMVEIYYNNQLKYQPQFHGWTNLQIIVNGNTVQVIGECYGSRIGHYFQFDNNGNISGPFHLTC